MAGNRAQKRYTKSVILLMASYVLILIGVVMHARNSPLHGPLGYVAGVLPALPVIGVFFVLGRYLVEEQDEYLRVQVTRQALVATGFALLRHVYAYSAAIRWFAGGGVGRCFNKLAARRGGGE